MYNGYFCVVIMNDLGKSIIRQMYYIHLLETEQKYYLSQKMPSGVKNTLHRLSNANRAGVEELLNQMPTAKDHIKKVMKDSEEKISVISDLISKLATMDTSKLIKLEQQLQSE